MKHVGKEPLFEPVSVTIMARPPAVALLLVIETILLELGRGGTGSREEPC